MLTGAAGTGKSSLAQLAETSIKQLYKVDFGKLLLQLKIDQGHSGLTYDELRRQSSEIVTPADVATVDAKLIDNLHSLRSTNHVLIDSHAVTHERFGYRISHYSQDELRRIGFDAIIVTYCTPAELVERREKDPQGRPPISLFEAQHHMALQESVAVNYAIICGCRCFFFDTTSQRPDTLVHELRRIVALIGGDLE